MAKTIIRKMATFLSKSGHLHTFICLLYGFCSFWPFFVVAVGHPTNVEQSVFRSALDGESTNTNVVSYRSTSLISLSLLAPFFLDYCTELTAHRKQKIKEKDDSILQNMSHFEKCVFIVGLFVVPMVAFVPTTFDHLGLLWLCMSRFQIICVVGILHVSVKSFDNNMIPMLVPAGLNRYSQLFFTTILAIAVNVSTWTAIYGDNNVNQFVATYLQLFLLLLLIVPFVRWVLHRFRHLNTCFCFLNRKIQSSELGGNVSGTAPERLYFPTLYVTLGTFSVVLIVSLLMTHSGDQFTSNYLDTYNILFIVIELFLLYYDLRKNKDDSLHHFRALVESRKQYLRYIAHEMRTPLNSAVLGLQVGINPSFPT